MNVAFGMKAHSGWAALVVLGTRSGELQVGVTETAQHANAAGAPIVSCDHVAVARGSFVALDRFVNELVVYPAIYEIWKWHFWLKRELALT